MCQDERGTAVSPAKCMCDLLLASLGQTDRVPGRWKRLVHLRSLLQWTPWDPLAAQDGEAGHPHAGPSPQAGAALRQLRKATDSEAQCRRPEDSREAVPHSVDFQAAKD